MTINDGPTISYINVGSLTIDAGYGDDDIDIDVNDLTDVLITIDGSNPSVNGDTLTVTGQVGVADAANFIPGIVVPGEVDGGRLEIAGLNGRVSSVTRWSSPTSNV